jgi:beta-phosphoglucomutase-like phosphatase (HAD superfamily)
MSTTLHLVYDGKVFHPEEPVALTPDTRVRVTIEVVETVKPQPQSFLKTARALHLEGPPDWSTRLQEELYPVPPDADE